MPLSRSPAHSADTAPWMAYRQPLVRDLAWVLASTPLLAPRQSHVHWLDGAWSARAHAASRDWLAALDQDPSPLLAALAARHDPRLGSHFEGLLAFWLGWQGNPLYRLVGHALPVRGGNLTLGELDFLVEERASGELQHWEVAVKFYLGVQPGGDPAHWVGPGLSDRLDRKLSRLLSHQLALTRTPEGAALLRQMGLPPPRPVCLLKGRLFYPAGCRPADWAPTHALPGHPAGWWCDHAAFRRDYAGRPLRWIRLPKTHWLTPVTADDAAVLIGDALDADALIETLVEAADNRATAVIGLGPDHNEVTRGFVTPPGWPQDSA